MRSDPAVRRHFEAAVHGKQMLHIQGGKIFTDSFRKVFREEVHDLVFQREKPGIYCHSYSSGREGLADRMQHMRRILLAFSHPFLEHHLSILHHHDTMNALAAFLYRPDIIGRSLFHSL